PRLGRGVTGVEKEPAAAPRGRGRLVAVVPQRLYFFGGVMGLVSLDSTSVVWVCDRSTVVVWPPISMDSLPDSSIFELDLSTRPLGSSNSTLPVALVLFRSALLILNGRPPTPATSPGSL